MLVKRFFIFWCEPLPESSAKIRMAPKARKNKGADRIRVPTDSKSGRIDSSGILIITKNCLTWIDKITIGVEVYLSPIQGILIWRVIPQADFIFGIILATPVCPGCALIDKQKR
jgi:hypothetical protein